MLWLVGVLIKEKWSESVDPELRHFEEAIQLLVTEDVHHGVEHGCCADDA